MRSSVLRALFAMACLLLGMAAHGVEFRRAEERRAVERKETREEAVERRRSAERLSAEARRSDLYEHEVASADGRERGRTLRDHVPADATTDGLRQHLAVSESLLRAEPGRGREPVPEHLTTYLDLRSAQIATRRTIEAPENARRIESWLKDTANRDPLVLKGESAEIVGVGMSRGSRDARHDPRQELWDTHRNEVRLRKEGSSYYIDVSRPIAADRTAQTLDAREIRYSQKTVNGVREVEASMREHGWRGPPVDVVRFPDGSMITFDHARVEAARRAGEPVQAVVREAAEPFPQWRIEVRRGDPPSTWGEAVELRIRQQGREFREAFPRGAPTIQVNS